MKGLKVGMVSLGCAKNLVDSEIVLGYLQKAGLELVQGAAEADFLVVNTCGFIEQAKEESINTILELAQHKETGRCQGLLVMGCLSKRYGEELQREIPEIDALLGTNELDQIPEVIQTLLGGKKVVQVGEQPFSYEDPDIPRILTTGSATCYLKIAEGCNHRCSFCVIPMIRGPFRSRSRSSILQEAQALSRFAIKELVLIAQDTTAYGSDNEGSLVSLLESLASVEIPWIRLLYTYPERITRELMEQFAKQDNLLKYLDVPLQHVAAPVLRRMGRGGDFASYLALLHEIRSHVPSMVLRSSFIVGFPGETEEDFSLLLDFLREAKLHHVGVFPFSQEEGTPAYDLPNQVPPSLKEERYERAMLVQQELSHNRNKELLGKRVEVLVEGYSLESEWVLVCRHKGQAKDIDGVTYVGNTQRPFGSLAYARIIEAHPYDLVAEIVD